MFANSRSSLTQPTYRKFAIQSGLEATFMLLEAAWRPGRSSTTSIRLRSPVFTAIKPGMGSTAFGRTAWCLRRWLTGWNTETTQCMCLYLRDSVLFLVEAASCMLPVLEVLKLKKHKATSPN